MRSTRELAGIATRRVVRKATRPVTTRLRRRRSFELLEKSSLFDQEWVELSLGRVFETRREAIEAYLENPLNCSPHPLFESDWGAVHRPWMREAADPLTWYLDRPGVQAQRKVHPMVDVTLITETWPQSLKHPEGPLAFWLAQADDDTPMPVPEGTAEITWGALRRHLFDTVGEVADVVRLSDRALRTTRLPIELVPVTAATRRNGPLVSIVMPTYNRATLVGLAIDSVVAQGYQDWELIVVDDGSTDDTLGVLDGRKAFDDRIKVISAPHGGVCRARNAALAQASGDYVAFLDSDNTWTPEFLAVAVDTLERNDWQMGHGVLELHLEDHVAFRAHEGTYDELKWSNHVDLNVLLVRRTLVEEIGGFDVRLRRAVDYDLVLRLAKRTPLHLLPVIGAKYYAHQETEDRISVRESPAWVDVANGPHLVDWPAAASAERVPGRVSVVLPLRIDMWHSVKWLRALQEVVPEDRDVEVVAVAVAPTRTHLASLYAMQSVFPSLKIVRGLNRVGLPLASNLGIAASTGEFLILARPEIEPLLDSPLGLIDALGPDTAVVQPLVLDELGTISSAGGVFVGNDPMPAPFLEAHNPADIRGLGTRPIPVTVSPMVALRAETALALHGADPLAGIMFEADLARRAALAGFGGSAVVTDTRITAFKPGRMGFAPDWIAAVRHLRAPGTEVLPGSEELWNAAGFDVVGHTSTKIPFPKKPKPNGKNEKKPVKAPDEKHQMLRSTADLFKQRHVVVPTRLEVTEGVPRLRWAIDIAAPASTEGLKWGDLHFARSLAAALERQGQFAAVDFRDMRSRRTRDYDDVVLHLRGLDRTSPWLGSINLQWIISHPDLITPQESAEFDRVYAASTAWAATNSAAWDLRIDPLLQCTDPGLFSPELHGSTDSSAPGGILFLGNSRGVFRPGLRYALETGADVTLIGSGWKPFVTPDKVHRKHVANDEVGALYANASIVLNDHWEDMRRDGFISNRLFDAAACAARVASDRVPGMDGLFGGCVAVFDDQPSLAAILGDPDAHFAPRQERLEVARRIAAEHSFDARAATLVQDAVQLSKARVRGRN